MIFTYSSQSVIYDAERLEQTVHICEFTEKYVDIPKFLNFCRECESYNRIWSCPNYDFNPMEIWNRYDKLDLVLMKFNFEGCFDDNSLEKLSDVRKSKNRIIKTVDKMLKYEKQKLMDEFLWKEMKIPGSFSLSAGSCDLCRDKDGYHNCSRIIGEPCRHPGKLRYSVESLGGDVVKSAKDIFGVELKWSGDSILPEYYVLMCGLLRQ